MDCGAQSPGQRTDRATVRNAAGSLGEGNAFGRDRQHRCRESLFGNALSSGVGRAFHGGTSQPTQRAPTVGSRTALGGNSKRARGTQGGGRSHGQLGWNPLGRAPRRSLRGSSWSAGGNRTTSGRLPLAAFPRSLPPPAPLPGSRAARGKSFRPTASRTHRKSTLKSLQKCSSKPPMADISIWQKTGHFYFALTARYPPCSDFGTTEDAGERSVDLGRILPPWPVATGRGYFQTGLFRIVCRLMELLRCGVATCRKRGHLVFSDCASAAVDSTRSGETEPQEQQQLGTAVHPVFATVEVP